MSIIFVVVKYQFILEVWVECFSKSDVVNIFFAIKCNNPTWPRYLLWFKSWGCFGGLFIRCFYAVIIHLGQIVHIKFIFIFFYQVQNILKSAPWKNNQLLYWTCIFVITDFCFKTNGTYIIKTLHMSKKKCQNYQKKYQHG